ncbi:MAG: UDP-N-acetylglucosamine transferase subunit [Pycnora praestabilis]|nr:MAG: UDP-N-acetylglucosamine transferase subunit [Pycnora praestabilis]
MAVSILGRLLIAATLLLFTSAFLRLLFILPSTNPQPPTRRKRGTPTHLLIVLGSGGHTAEMLSLLRDLETSLYTHRTYVISSGDSFSREKAIDFEHALESKAPRAKRNEFGMMTGIYMARAKGSYDILSVPRARRIHQSLWSTPINALKCLRGCFCVLNGTHADIKGHNYPDLIITNGPGTGVIIVLASLILRFFAVEGTQGKMRTVYVESWARVRGLSLSGKILVRVVDRFLVQWEGLRRVGGRGEFLGVLVE